MTVAKGQTKHLNNSVQGLGSDTKAEKQTGSKFTNSNSKLCMQKEKSSTITSNIPSITHTIRKREKKNEVVIHMNDFTSLALIDTGASISCISQKAYDLCRTKQDVIEATDIPVVKGVGGHVMHVTSKVTLSITMGRLTFPHTFYVLPQITHEVILGLDFLQEQNAKINFSTNMLELQNGLTEVELCHDQNKSSLVTVVGNISIPPRHEVIIPVTIRHKTNQNNAMGLVEPVSSLLTRNALMGAKCLVKPTNKRASYRILNPTNVEVNLKNGQRIGRFFRLIDVDSICTVAAHSAPLGKEDSTNVECINLTSEEHIDKKYVDIAHDLGFQLDNATLDESQKLILLDLIGRNRDVFAKDITELGKTDIYQHPIITGDAPAVRQPFYSASPQMKREIERQQNEMLKNNIISPSISEWHSPVVMVKKSNSTYRFAIDYRKINSVTQPISFPLPRLNDIFDTIAESEANMFSVLDLASGFWQIGMDPATKHKSAFITHQGVFEFNRMPYGLMNAPMAFCMVMTEVLRNLNWQCCIIYVDDILCFSQNFSTHLHHLQQIFARLREANLKIQPSKCIFAAERVVYLGHEITSKKVSKLTKPNCQPY